MDFKPNLTPKEIIHLGSFGGIYFDTDNEKINIDYREFPSDWFKDLPDSYYKSKIYNKNINFFNIKCGQTQEEWEKKGWINKQDPRGWFQWYCRYTLGRRLPEIDVIQINRWRAFGPRHIGGIKKNCPKKFFSCRKKQRQALLQWAYSPFF